MTVLDQRDQQSAIKARERRSVAVGVLSLCLVGLAAVVFAALIWGKPQQLPATAIFTTDEEGSVSLIDTETGEWIYQVPNAVLSRDRSVLYQATPDGEETVVTALDPVNVEERWMQRIPGRLQIRVVSPMGDAVALMHPRQNPGLYAPEPREMTNVYVARTDGSPWHHYTLEGNYEPEAMSVNTQTLFLLKFLPASNPDRYEVHRLDLETGTVINDYTPEVNLEPWMKGHARGQVMAPDGRYLYTLYSIDAGEDPIHDPANPSVDHYAFVHVISLEEEWSFCIFLGMPFGMGRIDAMGIATSADGSNLGVVDLGTGTLVEIDTGQLEVARVSSVGQWPVEFLEPGRSVPLSIGSDNMLYLAWDQSVSAYEPEDRNPVAGWTAGGSIRSMDVSEDGRYLRVAAPGQIQVIDLATGEEMASITLPEEANEVVIGPPGTKTRFEQFTCAC